MAINEDLDRIAWAIDADGIIRHEDAVAGVVGWARNAGLRAAAVDVLGDLTAPPAARERAFGKVARALVADAAMGAAGPEWVLAN